MTQTVNDIIKEVHKETALWSEEEQEDFFLSPIRGDSLIRYHSTLGMYIRNKYNLWQIPWTPELRNGVDYSPYHPDSVSQTIIEEVWKLGIYKEQ